MNGLILFADYFEDTEALSTMDVLLRAGHNVFRASCMLTKNVKTQCGLEIICDCLLDDVKLDDFDYLVLPGGKASFTILNEDKRVENIIDYFINNHKLVASICAAPHLLSRKGYFDNLEYTCFPGFETYAKNAIYRRDLGVVKNDKFVTAKSMYYSIDFALAIINFLEGKEKEEKVKLSLMGER